MFLLGDLGIGTGRKSFEVTARDGGEVGGRALGCLSRRTWALALASSLVKTRRPPCLKPCVLRCLKPCVPLRLNPAASCVSTLRRPQRPPFVSCNSGCYRGVFRESVSAPGGGLTVRLALRKLVVGIFAPHPPLPLVFFVVSLH